MPDHHDEKFTAAMPRFDEIELTDAYDELPLWSAPFGLKLLDTVALRPGIVALDIGCGTGFPTLELAQRLGPTATVHGVDPWAAALARIRHKIKVCGIRNVVLHETAAERLPFADASIDLIVSNNGFNNIADLDGAMAECARVAKPGAQLVYTYNLPASMREVYDEYDALLGERGLEQERQALTAHVFAKRKPLEFTSAVFERSGFGVERIIEDTFRIRFADATAMFAHFFMRIAFIPSWIEIVEPSKRQMLFTELERRLNAAAERNGGLTLTIPLACYDCRRASPR